MVAADWKVGRGLITRAESYPPSDWNDHASILATDAGDGDDGDGDQNDHGHGHGDVDGDGDRHLLLHESWDDWALDSWQRSAGPFVNNPCWGSDRWQ